MLSYEELLAHAKKARKASYSPYSNFAVGAALECLDGRIIYGANIENASFGLTMCAERNAIFQARMLGYKFDEFAQLLIVSDSKDILTAPCGACRQVLSELYSYDAPLIFANMEGDCVKTSIRELLPYIFTKENMNQ